MIVAAETNFILELAFRHDEASQCDRLIELAAERSIELAVPACSLFEPYETLVRRSKQRARLLEKFKFEVQQLARSEFYTVLPDKAKEIVEPIAGSTYVYENSLRRALIRVLSVSRIIPLSAGVMTLSFELQETCSLDPQDAIVLASVLLFMREKACGPKLFANRNSRDFVKPEVVAHLTQCDCRVLSNFTAARYATEASLLN